MKDSSLLFDQLENQIQRGRLELIVEQNAATFIAANLVSPILITVILWLTGESPKWLFAWILFGLLLCAGRALHHHEFKNFASYSKPAHQWEFELILLSMLSGFFWAASGILFINPDNPGLSVFIVAAIFAHISAAVASHATHIRIFIAFCFSLWIPACAFFIGMNSTFYYQIAILGSFFVLANLSFALNQSRSVTQSLRLQYENVKLLNELKHQKIIADEANHAKSRFMAAASHDLRQPLHAMNLFTDSLAQRIENPETGRILNLLRGSINTLRELFDSLLDISRLDAGVIKPQLQAFNLKDMITKLLDEYSLHTSNKGLQLRSRLYECWVYSDPVLVEQILRNLIWNAIKYTDTGGILIGCRNRRRKTVFEIWDTGVGIIESEQHRIFEEFHQTNNPDRDRSQGIGLGLSIVQRTARLLNLDVGMRSNYGNGSKFFIGFEPANVPHLPSPTSKKTQPIGKGKKLDFNLTGVSVLVVDDEVAILDALEVVLQDWGCKVALCKSIQEVKSSLEDFNPDILLTDFNLNNGETGDSVIQLVDYDMGYKTPAIIITGAATAEGLNNIKGQQTNILYKPLQAEELRKKMVEVLND